MPLTGFEASKLLAVTTYCLSKFQVFNWEQSKWDQRAPAENDK